MTRKPCNYHTDGSSIRQRPEICQLRRDDVSSAMSGWLWGPMAAASELWAGWREAEYEVKWSNGKIQASISITHIAPITCFLIIKIELKRQRQKYAEFDQMTASWTAAISGSAVPISLQSESITLNLEKNNNQFHTEAFAGRNLYFERITVST